MPFRRYKGRADDGGVGHIASSGIAATTRRRSDTDCALAVSFRCWPCVVQSTEGLGRWRWVVERTFAWLNQFRRLRVRYDKHADIHEAFLSLRCALICWHALRKRWAIG
jgi:transposase